MKAEIAVAYIQGKQIQYFDDISKTWQNVFPYIDEHDLHRLDGDFMYRICSEKYPVLNALPEDIKNYIDDIVQDLINYDHHKNMTETEILYHVGYYMYVQGGMDDNDLN